MTLKRTISIIVLWVLLITIFFSPKSQANASRWPHPAQIEPEIFNGVFSFPPYAVLNQPMQLTFAINPVVSFQIAEIKLFLPDGVKYLAGILDWEGEAKSNIPISLATDIFVLSPGEYRIRAHVKGQSIEGTVEKSYYLFIYADNLKIEISQLPPKIDELKPLSLSDTILSMEQIPNKLEGSIDLSPSFFTSDVTVTGQWQYEDDGGTLHPIRQARVKILNDGIIDTEIGSGFTDNNGNYSFQIDVSGTRSIYVKIESESNASKITDGNLLDIAYWGQIPTVVISETNPTTWNLGTNSFGSNYANWQAMDYVLDEYIWLNDQVGWTRSQIEVEWPEGDWPESDGDNIYLPDKAIPGADWDRSTVIHEYAHCVMYAAYGSSWPPGGGGAHAIWSENIGLDNGNLVPGNGGFAIIEGWAEFIEAAIDNNAGNLAQLSPQGDLDGDGTWGTARLSFTNGSWGIAWDDRDDARMRNLEDNEWWMGENYRNDNLGNIVEGAVASILWDIFDERNDDDLNVGFDAIWAVFESDNPDDIVEFRLSYLNDNPSHENGLCSIFDNHGIPCLNILSPNQIAPAFAGSNVTPSKIVIIVVTDYGLQQNDFTVTIGGKNATIVTVYEAKGMYSLEVMPPTQPANGLYNLQVTVGTRNDSETSAVQYAETYNVDIVPTIDRSGSMGTEKMNAAKNAAKQFVDFMQLGDMVGVVSFSTSVSTNFSLTTIGADTRTLAKSAIDTLSSGGSTLIGGGLQQAQQQLTTLGNANHPWAIVLLSDGQENVSPYVRDVLPAIVASKTVVHTVGLGSDVDEAMMLDIASQTGGTYNFAPTPQELSGIYSTIGGSVANRQTLFVTSGVAQQGVTEQKDVVVDSTISDATFSVSWSSSGSTIELVLRKPNGQIIDPAVAASDPNVEYVAGSTYRYYQIKQPTLTSGVWRMRITGSSVPASLEEGVLAPAAGESYIARVNGQAGLTMRFYLDHNNYLTTEKIKFIVTLSDHQPIRGAAVNVSVQSPSQSAQAIRSSQWIEINGDTMPDPVKAAEINAAQAQASTSVTLFDDGAHEDGLANDGVYANIFGGAYSEGTYVFSASASGSSNTGELFTRFAELSTYIVQNPDPASLQIFLPILMLKASTPSTLEGIVTNRGAPLSYAELKLRFYNGSSWSTVATTNTLQDGSYRFTSLPALGSDQYMYVRWDNPGGFDGLWTWHCDSIGAQSPSENYRCDFDVEDIQLVSPLDEASLGFPVTFTWQPRAFTTESYELDIYDYDDYDPNWYTDPRLGYTNQYILNSLPSGLSFDEQYVWEVWVYGANGFGLSYDLYSVTFLSSSSVLQVNPAALPLKRTRNPDILR